MAIDVETKDCTALDDLELEEMANICADGPARFDIGLLSKQREEWVLITQARANGVLQGFSFCTLERIGGTPSVLIGLASSGVFETLLFEVTPFDPGALATPMLALTVAVLLAALPPAIRAVRIDPAETLRIE